MQVLSISLFIVSHPISKKQIKKKKKKKEVSVMQGGRFYEEIQNYERFKLHSIALTVCITIKLLC